MIEVIVVCEGQTEERFVKDVLATHFGQQGVVIPNYWAERVGFEPTGRFNHAHTISNRAH